jgi:pentose-5-phosphate-3-epimerase
MIKERVELIIEIDGEVKRVNIQERKERKKKVC